jgi:hypothetical protein
MKKYVSLFLLLSLISLPSYSHSSQAVRYSNLLATSAQLNEFFLQQLDLALSKSEGEFGPYELKQTRPMYQSAALSALKKRNKIDVVWTLSSKEREAHAKAVKFDLLQGLNNYKVIVFSAKAEKAFKGINSLEDLTSMVGLQGHDWADTHFLRQKGLRLKSDFVFENLMNKVAESESFYTLSSVLSYKTQLSAFANRMLAHEGLLLHYASPINFFVNKSNTQLAKRIEKGLAVAREDGSFQALFKAFLSENESFQALDIDSRKILDLDDESHERADDKSKKHAALRKLKSPLNR